MNTECCAIIPARGGSKGIARKNLREIARKPLIAYTVEAAIAARTIDRVYVSTDDPEIAATAREWGASIITRPAELAGDTASSESALLHALEHLADEERYTPDLLAFLQCTSPLTAPQDIDGTVEALLTEHADSALSVAPFHYFLWKRGNDGNAEGINHDKSERALRQERGVQFLETGAVYVMRVQGFEETKHRFFGKTALYVMPEERVLEIDDPVDLAVAEALIGDRRKSRSRAKLPDPVQGLAMDFDGVFTDNRVYVAQDGSESVACSRGDGMGLELLRKGGMPMIVISKETNPVVKRRCEKLQIDCVHSMEDKHSALLRWCGSMRRDLDNVIYVGNDINDVDCLRAAGCGVVVADAHPEAKQAADLVLTARGGHGALRELCDLIVTVQGAKP